MVFVQVGTEKKWGYIHPNLICHGCVFKGKHYLSGFPATPEAAKARIMEHKQATWASKNVVVATNVEVENPEVEEEVDDGIPTYEELKETCVFAGVTVDSSYNSNVALYRFCEIGISTDPYGKGHNYTMTGVGNSESVPNTIVSSKQGPVITVYLTTVVAGVSFVDIVRSNRVPTPSATAHKVPRVTNF